MTTQNTETERVSIEDEDLSEGDRVTVHAHSVSGSAAPYEISGTVVTNYSDTSFLMEADESERTDAGQMVVVEVREPIHDFDSGEDLTGDAMTFIDVEREVETDGGVEQFDLREDDEDGDGGEVDLTFRIVDVFENSYGDDKAAVATPAPWDTPDDMTPANEVVKTLDWEEHHYSFDDDRGAWTLDMSGLRPLGEAAEDAGYEWEGLAGRRDRLEGTDDGEDLPEAFTDMLERATEGDRVKVRYEKKNGNGENTYKGTITTLREAGFTDSWGQDRTAGFVFEDTEGKVKKVKPDDNGEVSMFHTGRYPYMGAVLQITVIR